MLFFKPGNLKPDIFLEFLTQSCSGWNVSFAALFCWSSIIGLAPDWLLAHLCRSAELSNQSTSKSEHATISCLMSNEQIWITFRRLLLILRYLSRLRQSLAFRTNSKVYKAPLFPPNSSTNTGKGSNTHINKRRLSTDTNATAPQNGHCSNSQDPICH